MATNVYAALQQIREAIKYLNAAEQSLGYADAFMAVGHPDEDQIEHLSQDVLQSRLALLALAGKYQEEIDNAQ